MELMTYPLALVRELRRLSYLTEDRLYYTSYFYPSAILSHAWAYSTVRATNTHSSIFYPVMSFHFPPGGLAGVVI